MISVTNHELEVAYGLSIFTLVTLNNLERRNSPYFALFHLIQ